MNEFAICADSVLMLIKCLYMGVDNKWYNEKITIKRDQNIQVKKLVLDNRFS